MNTFTPGDLAVSSQWHEDGWITQVSTVLADPAGDTGTGVLIRHGAYRAIVHRSCISTLRHLIDGYIAARLLKSPAIVTDRSNDQLTALAAAHVGHCDHCNSDNQVRRPYPYGDHYCIECRDTTNPCSTDAMPDRIY